jgi:hypothetical protein
MPPRLSCTGPIRLDTLPGVAALICSLVSMAIDKTLAGDTVKCRGRFLARPLTKLGWWSAALAGLCFLIFLIIVSGQAGRAYFRMIGAAMVLSGLAAGVTSLVAVLRNRERSWLVMLPLCIGAFWLLVVAVEIIFNPS